MAVFTDEYRLFVNPVVLVPGQAPISSQRTLTAAPPVPQALATSGYIKYSVGSVVYWRPLGVVQVKVPSGCCSTVHLGSCLS